MSSRVLECRQFSANIFNKNKCSHCFHQREEHSASALECNRVTRKISKCGYLFVAPDWDFTNPLYRTKRWQRRWFVLYDDGELTYAVDDHPETVPQAIIGMAKVVEVAPAEEVTGHQYSIAITAPDRVTFIKGTCFEEAKWWLDVLSVFVSIKGRAKRNATFPGSKSTYISNTKSFDEQPSKSPPTRDKIYYGSNLSSSRNRTYTDQYLIESIDTIDSGSCLINMSSALQRNEVDVAQTNNSKNEKSSHWKDMLDEKPTRDENAKKTSPYRPKSLPIIPPTNPMIVSAIVKKMSSVNQGSLYSRTSSSSSSSHLAASPTNSSGPDQPQSTERGDPDGDCGLSESTANYGNDSEQGGGLSSDEIISVRKGWLLKQDLRTKEWSRYWFSQKGAALFYYRDPIAEERGVLDGVLDVNNITSISEISVPKSFGFQLSTWDNRRFILAATSSNARNNWINVIKSAAGLPPSKVTYEMSKEPEKSEDKPKLMKEKTRSFIMSSDDEYRTASEGGKRDSIDLGSPLSPSPPIILPSLTRKTKERLRRVSRGKLKRHDTVDSVASDDLPATVREESELQSKIADAEKEIKTLRAEAQERETKMSDLLVTLKRTEFELSTRKREVEDTRDTIAVKLEESTRNAQQVIKHLTVELENSRDMIKDLEDQLARGIAENESLYKQLQEVSPAHSLCDLSRSKMKRMDSFSDLASLSDIDPFCLDKDMLVEEYNDLKIRFEKAINELRMMKKELKEAHNMYDMLELQYSSLQMQLERQKQEEQDQGRMMAARIQDLTTKYSASEKNIRNLKQKLVRTEKRRTLSLKGREALTLQKDLEEKVSELELKVDAIGAAPLPPGKEETSKKRLRRKSLDSSATPSMQLVLRLNAIEKRIEGITKPMNSQQPWDDQIDTRLKYLETVVATSQEIIKCNLKYLHNVKSKLRASTDMKEVLRHLEKCLNESLKVLTITTDDDQVTKYSGFELIRSILSQLDNQIRSKLGDLLVQRRLLKESNKLTYEKDLELLAERIAFESVSFGRLRNAMNFGEGEAKAPRTEVIETIQLVATLKNKLNGKSPPNTIRNSTDVLVTVLARRLILTASKLKNPTNSDYPAVSSEIMEDLLQQQRDLSASIRHYKTTTLETLAYQLATEALESPHHDVLQTAVQGIWHHANESVSFELIQAEIADLMSRNAQKLKSFESVSGYTLNLREKLTFENIADEAQDALRREMETCMEELTELYRDCLEKLKRDQWRLHLEQERKVGDSRQMLADFADITAHKALIDARIAVLSGNVSSSNAPPRDSVRNVAQIQKYEELFCNLCQDLEIAHPEDILADADFNLMYRYFTTEFLMNNLELKELCTALNKLEKAVSSLLHMVNPNASIPSSEFEAQCIEDICTKCEDLETAVDSVILSVDMLKNSCDNYKKMQENYKKLSAEHEEEITEIKRIHMETTEKLTKQIESHKQVMQSLEMDKEEILSKFETERQILTQQEKDLKQMTDKMKEYRMLCHEKELDNIELIQKVEQDNKKLFTYKEKYEELCINYNKQCDEIMVLQKERNEIYEQYEKEQDRCKRFEKHLEKLQDEFNFEVERLQAFSREKPIRMSSSPEGDSLRQRYQAEIEQLRALCEKGLAAMEASHKKIIQEMQEKHREEVEQLLSDKEQALAEETQATLAALDAMRKAHQVEVQREVARFKQEFLKQSQKVSDACFNKDKEEELEDVRNEILSLSEKYTTKCVEAASLEEKLKVVTHQLKHTEEKVHKLERKQYSAFHDESQAVDSKCNKENPSISMEPHPLLQLTKGSKTCQKPRNLEEVSYTLLATRKANNNKETIVEPNEHTSALPLDGKDVERIQRFELDI